MDWSIPAITSGSVTESGGVGQIELSQVCSQHFLQTSYTSVSGTSGQISLHASLDGVYWFGVSGSGRTIGSDITAANDVVGTMHTGIAARFLRVFVTLESGSIDLFTALTSRS